MIQTKLEELDLAEAAQLQGMDPFTLRDRLLIRALKGRCAFDLGLALKCYEGSVEITEGRRDGLELSLGTAIVGLKISTAYEFETTLTYSCGPCDSVAPVLVFDEAYIQVWEVRSLLTAGLSKRNETVFIPTKRPFVASNKVLDDPDCGCGSPEPPRGGPDDPVSLAAEEMVTRIISFLSLTPSGTEALPDPSRVASEALFALGEMLKPFQTERPERVGIADMHGNVTWFVGEQADALPRTILLSTDSNAAVRRRLAITAHQQGFPVLAVTPAPDASWGRFRVALNEPGHGLVPYEDWDLRIASDHATAAWTTVDFSSFSGGQSGQIELELYNARDELVAEPLVEEFVVVVEPALSEELVGELRRA